MEATVHPIDQQSGSEIRDVCGNRTGKRGISVNSNVRSTISQWLRPVQQAVRNRGGISGLFSAYRIPILVVGGAITFWGTRKVRDSQFGQGLVEQRVGRRLIRKGEDLVARGKARSMLGLWGD